MSPGHELPKRIRSLGRRESINIPRFEQELARGARSVLVILADSKPLGGRLFEVSRNQKWSADEEPASKLCDAVDEDLLIDRLGQRGVTSHLQGALLFLSQGMGRENLIALLMMLLKICLSLSASD